MKKRSLIPIAKNPKGVTLKSERQTLQIAFLFPLFLSLLILVLVPMASLLGLSFTNYKMTGGRFRFIGLENYIDLFTDKGFINAAQNTIFMVFFSVLLQMVVGVAAALAIQRMKRLRGLVQALIVMPMVIPPVVAGLIWRILLIPKYGGIHALLYGIGITLGIMSSFLGIGGGPINLVVLYYFFSMSTKVAAQNSLYIILISQITSVTTTLFTKTVPEFEWLWLVLMVAGGIGGGAVGRKINKKIDDKHVEILFIGLMFTIIGISCYNTWALMK